MPVTPFPPPPPPHILPSSRQTTNSKKSTKPAPPDSTTPRSIVSTVPPPLYQGYECSEHPSIFNPLTRRLTRNLYRQCQTPGNVVAFPSLHSRPIPSRVDPKQDHPKPTPNTKGRCLSPSLESIPELVQNASPTSNRPAPLSGAGASQDPTIRCAVRAESTSNIGSRDANREGGPTVLVRPPKAPSLSVPGYRIANANQYHSTLCTVRANSTSNNGKWGGRREGGWRSGWWTKGRCCHEPARPRGRLLGVVAGWMAGTRVGI